MLFSWVVTLLIIVAPPITFKLLVVKLPVIVALPCITLFELLIFNIVAIVSIICLQIGIKKILLEHIIYVSKYIDKRCSLSKRKNIKTNKMKGGAFNTAAFFGVNEPQYSKYNDTSDLLKINFEVARNAIPLKGGGIFQLY